MQKVGDPIDGYCQRCKRNVFMSVAATDGREIFAAVCRTCDTKQDYRPEVSNEVLQEAAMKKLMRGAAKKRKVGTGRTPDIISRGRRVDESGGFDRAAVDRAAPSRGPAAGPTANLRRANEAMGRAMRSEGGPTVVTRLHPGESAPSEARSADARGADAGPAAAPAPRLSEALRHRPSMNEGPVPAGRRRSGAAALQIPMTLPTPKEEVLPPPAALSDVTSMWRAATAKLGPRDGKVYTSERTYGVGDVLLHKRHGMGIVESIVHEQAIMVLFRDDRRVIEMATPEPR